MLLPVVEALQGVDVLTGPKLILKAVEISSRLPQLKLIQLTSAGYDEFNNGGPEVLEGLRNNGVMFANNGGGELPEISAHRCCRLEKGSEHVSFILLFRTANGVAVAETTIMLMLATCKNMLDLAVMARSGAWTAHHSTLNVRGAEGARELSSQVIGIVGFGNIGRMVARQLSGFRCKVLYYDVQELMVGRDGELDAERVGTLEELLQRSDIVTVHVPNSPATNGRLTGKKLFGKEQFDLMKETAIFISTCRGPVTNQAALIEALESGSIYGAGLDVTDPDPAGSVSSKLPHTRRQATLYSYRAFVLFLRL
eukprot:SAG31_NODE_4745_length_2985_cov_2.095634_3_plen_311_part_00